MLSDCWFIREYALYLISYVFENGIIQVTMHPTREYIYSYPIKHDGFVSVVEFDPLAKFTLSFCLSFNFFFFLIRISLIRAQATVTNPSFDFRSCATHTTISLIQWLATFLSLRAGSSINEWKLGQINTTKNTRSI